jgi:hypothetical protein
MATRTNVETGVHEECNGFFNEMFGIWSPIED